MKPVTTNPCTQDRLATGDEIRRASTSLQERLLEVFKTQGNYCQMDSDQGGIVRYTLEEFEFFTYLSEMDEGKPK